MVVDLLRHLVWTKKPHEIVESKYNLLDNKGNNLLQEVLIMKIQESYTPSFSATCTMKSCTFVTTPLEDKDPRSDTLLTINSDTSTQ